MPQYSSSPEKLLFRGYLLRKFYSDSFYSGLFSVVVFLLVGIQEVVTAIQREVVLKLLFIVTLSTYMKCSRLFSLTTYQITTHSGSIALQNNICSKLLTAD
jgi:hypothetical protein